MDQRSFANVLNQLESDDLSVIENTVQAIRTVLSTGSVFHPNLVMRIILS